MTFIHLKPWTVLHHTSQIPVYPDWGWLSRTPHQDIDPPAHWGQYFTILGDRICRVYYLPDSLHISWAETATLTTPEFQFVTTQSWHTASRHRWQQWCDICFHLEDIVMEEIL